ncbi:hypothetical protein LIA77_07918 [Sarocladium implicatum]|nr:hypothetical protein LIA77_07918 [Sarocladium implicatum]
MANKITWGVEFEFCLPSSAPGDSTEETNNAASQAALRLLALYLHNQLDLPVAAICQCSSNEPMALTCAACPLGFHLENQMAVFRTPPQFPQYNITRQGHFFFLSTDMVTVDDVNEDWQGLEISTRAQDLAELQAGIPEIRHLVQGLSRLDKGIAVTDLCGLHIHVGDQDGITLDLAKRIVTLVVLLEEDLLLRLISPDRLECQFFQPITHTSKMARWAQNRDRNDHAVLSQNILPPGHQQGRYWAESGHKIGHILQLLWQCPDIDRLEDGLLSPRPFQDSWKSSLFLVVRLKEDSDSEDDDRTEPVHSTIEFRYPQMSFDCDFVQMWTQVATRIVEVARDIETHAYQRAVRNILEQLENTEAETIVPQLLTALGFDRQTIRGWAQIVRRHEEGNDPSLLRSGPYRRLRNDL